MGIRNLNRYLRENCPESIRCINISDLSGKRIAIDISIYLYKYETENALLENMYLMLSIFCYYNIIPIFIFDGKPPPEKKALLIKRKEDRETAQEEYNKLQNRLMMNNYDGDDVDDDYDNDEKQDIISAMDQLKKQFVQINKEKIEMVKNLIRAYGATYFDAPGEADELCALLVIKKKVWACLSEDMDLFVYGCTRVLRYFSLIGHTAVLYYMKGILDELKMTQKEFKEVCILSGTDYNIHTNHRNSNVSLNLTLKHFRKFKETEQDTNNTFYTWLLSKTNYIFDIQLLTKINDMFNLDVSHVNLDIFKKIKIINGPKNQYEIESIMKEDDFIFVKTT
jgi:flap endonuclease-1